MGHNLGMRHDFEKNKSKNCWRYARRGYCIWRHVEWMERNCKHSCKIGRGAKCDKSYNIMSYSNKSRLRWSTCSKLDFQFHYIAHQENWCLDSKFVGFFNKQKMCNLSKIPEKVVAYDHVV